MKLTEQQRQKRREIHRRYYKANREKIRARMSRYRRANRQKIRDQWRAWWLKNVRSKTTRRPYVRRAK